MATFKERVASMAERRAAVAMRAEAALAPLREFLDEIRGLPGYALVDVALDRHRCTMDGRVAGSFVSPPLGGGEGTAWHDFRIEQTSAQGGLIRVSRPGREGEVELAYGAESRKGRSSLTFEVGRMRKALGAALEADAPPAVRR